MAVLITGDFGLVPIVMVLSFFLHLWMSSKVGAARKKYKVWYPTMYAIESENKEAKLFNCVQRGHQNFLEAVPFFVGLLVLGGIQHPKLASVFGFLFLVARFVYFKGYATGNPANRKYGLFHYFCLLGLVGCNVSLSVHLLGAR